MNFNDVAEALKNVFRAKRFSSVFVYYIQRSNFRFGWNEALSQEAVAYYKVDTDPSKTTASAQCIAIRMFGHGTVF